MPVSLARRTLRGAALNVGALFAGCVVFYNVGGEAAWAAGLLFVGAFIPAALSGAIAGAAVHWLSRRPPRSDAPVPADAGITAPPSPRWRRIGLWMLGAVAGYAAITYGPYYLATAERIRLDSMTLALPAIIVGGAAALRADALVARQRVWALSVMGIFAVMPLLQSGWWVVQGRMPLPPEIQRRWATDSTDYERRLARWVSDSAALDSVAATRDRRTMVALLRSRDSQRAEITNSRPRDSTSGLPVDDLGARPYAPLRPRP